MTSPVVGPVPPERVAGERRLSLERRIAPRRRQVTPVAVDYRSGRDRRQRVERRESASGHIRNVLQALYALLAPGRLDDEAGRTLTGAVERLWVALAEIERLTAARRELAGRMMQGNR